MFGRHGGLVMGMLLVLGLSAVGGLAGLSPLSLQTGRQVVAFAEKTLHASAAPLQAKGGYLATGTDPGATVGENSRASESVRQGSPVAREPRRAAAPAGSSRRDFGGYLSTRTDARFARQYRLQQAAKYARSVVTAARPGVATLGLLAPGGAQAPIAGEYGFPKHRRLGVAEGLGPGWCLAYGGYPLGPSVDGVYACGPSLGPSNPFDTDGFQCVELSTRFLWDVYRKVVRKVPDGAELVSLAHKQLHIPVGRPGPGHVPASGDIISLSGPTADANGHTAVVSAVNVNASGNGTIQVMEENGSLSGWDELNVSHWRETFGDPLFDAGLYYYTNVSWLKLAHASRSKPMAPPQGTLRYSVEPLGQYTSEANGINDRRQVAGMVDGRMKDHTPIHRVFLAAPGRVTSFAPPKGDEYLTGGSGISSKGVIAAWSIHSSGQPYPYVISANRHASWTQLPALKKGKAVGEAMGVDAAGDVGGWMLSPSGSSSLGVVWQRRHGRYHPRILWPNRYFHDPIVNAADTFHEAAGTETLGTSKTSGVFWAPSGKAFRLQPLSGHPVLDVPTAMYSHWIGTGRLVTVVGSSLTRGGVIQGCYWQIWIHAGRVMVGRPSPIGQAPGYYSSWGTSINRLGWIVGGLAQGTAARSGFLWRPGIGTIDVNRLLAPASHWHIVALHSINGAGVIVGEAYRTGGQGTSRVLGVVLVPTSVGVAPRS